MNKPEIEFKGFPKIARLVRDMVVTEKIDGTNGLVHVSEDGEVFAGSRTRWITPEDDNYGFARWVEDHKEALARLGPGSHFGEWWGRGIQRNYGLDRRRFSLFNVMRWHAAGKSPVVWPDANPAREGKKTCEAPACCDVVPILYLGTFCTSAISCLVSRTRGEGSTAAPGFMQPEGLVVYHKAANTSFKVLLENDSAPKGLC